MTSNMTLATSKPDSRVSEAWTGIRQSSPAGTRQLPLLPPSLAGKLGGHGGANHGTVMSSGLRSQTPNASRSSTTPVPTSQPNGRASAPLPLQPELSTEIRLEDNNRVYGIPANHPPTRHTENSGQRSSMSHFPDRGRGQEVNPTRDFQLRPIPVTSDRNGPLDAYRPNNPWTRNYSQTHKFHDNVDYRPRDKPSTSEYTDSTKIDERSPTYLHTSPHFRQGLSINTDFSTQDNGHRYGTGALPGKSAGEQTNAVLEHYPIPGRLEQSNRGFGASTPVPLPPPGFRREESRENQGSPTKQHHQGMSDVRVASSDPSGYKHGLSVTGPGRQVDFALSSNRVATPLSRPESVANNMEDLICAMGEAPTDAEDPEEVEMGCSTSERMSEEEVSNLKRQMAGLEAMYVEVLKVLHLDSEYIPARIRQSYSSGGEQGRGSNSSRSRLKKDVRTLHKRLGKVETHMVTLAKSVYELSSELTHLRGQITRGEISGNAPSGHILPLTSYGEECPKEAGTSPDSFSINKPGFLRYLANPRRLTKLQRFFGDKPPFIRYFLQHLGYEIYAEVFEAEGIDILELPCISEGRLKEMGIPLGPRIRILKRAADAFAADGVSVYYV